MFMFTFPQTMTEGRIQHANSRTMNNTSKPNCQTHCGNITVPYPFGIGNEAGCALDD
jgi:hypothetical protein